MVTIERRNLTSGAVLVVLSIALVMLSATAVDAATTCYDSSGCSVRAWLTSLQEEAYLLDCTSVKLQKSIAILNATAGMDSTIVNKRMIQLNKLKQAMLSLSIEIQAMNATCTKFDGPDCNLTKEATTATPASSNSPYSAASLLSMGDLVNSNILNMTQSDRFIREIINGTSTTIALKLIYKATRDGFAALDFHTKADGKGPTVTLIKSPTGAVFGGYTSASWTSDGSRTTDSTAFLFSIISPTLQERYAKIFQTQQGYATYGLANFGPVFGGGHDMCVMSNSNLKDSNSYFNPNTYQIVAKDYYTGKELFTTTEIEVYTIK